jgi:hypothetical protein
MRHLRASNSTKELAKCNGIRRRDWRGYILDSRAYRFSLLLVRIGGRSGRKRTSNPLRGSHQFRKIPTTHPCDSNRRGAVPGATSCPPLRVLTRIKFGKVNTRSSRSQPISRARFNCEFPADLRHIRECVVCASAASYLLLTCLCQSGYDQFHRVVRTGGPKSFEFFALELVIDDEESHYTFSETRLEMINRLCCGLARLGLDGHCH